MIMATELLSKIYRICWGIVLDEEDEIRKEYDVHMGEFARQWLITMSALKSGAGTPKIVYRARTSLRPLAGFDPDDVKFLEVAVKTPGKRVVSGDSDFVDRKGDIAREYQIEVLTVQEAIVELETSEN